MRRRNLRSQTAHADVVRCIPIVIAHTSEHLARCGKVAEHDAVERQNRDEMLPPASAAPWRNSFEYWLFCHWPNYPLFAQDRIYDVDGCPRPRYRRLRLRSHHVHRPRACPSNIERGDRCGCVWRVPQWRLRPLGNRLSHRGDAGGLSRAPVVPLHRRRVADARRLGLTPPPLGKSDLAVHADIVLRVFCVRRAHRGVVPGWRA